MEKSVITLAGVKHCGKSTLGRLAAERCGFAFFDADAELEIYLSGVGKVKFEFTGTTNVKDICKIISTYALA